MNVLSNGSLESVTGNPLLLSDLGPWECLPSSLAERSRVHTTISVSCRTGFPWQGRQNIVSNSYLRTRYTRGGLGLFFFGVASFGRRNDPGRVLLVAAPLASSHFPPPAATFPSGDDDAWKEAVRDGQSCNESAPGKSGMAGQKKLGAQRWASSSSLTYGGHQEQSQKIAQSLEFAIELTS